MLARAESPVTPVIRANSFTQRELERLLQERALSVVFQPIVDLAAGRLIGYEACTRGPADGPLHSPLTLFDTAAQHGRLVELELLASTIACERFAQLTSGSQLFLNLSAPSLVDAGCREAIGRLVSGLRLDPGNIVIEVTEQQPLDDYERIRAAVGEFRARGFDIAIDDLGAGYAGLRIWAELKPDYVKVDRHFVQGIDEDVTKRSFVESLVQIGRGLNCRVIAEGIETEQELRTLLRLGISLGQGFLLGLPRSIPATAVPTVVLQQLSGSSRYAVRAEQEVGSLAQAAPVVAPTCPLEHVVDRFHADLGLTAVPVVDDAGRPRGIVTRHALLDLFAARYSRELHARKPVEQFLDPAYVCVDERTRLGDVSRLVTENSGRELIQTFVVTREDRYLGIGRTQSLLERITEHQIRSARYSNPLTLLPGSVPVSEHVDALLAADGEFRLAYCDLNHFKPYNDVYGFAKGDGVIQLVADLLRRHADPETDLVGHIGGDDFVAVFRSADWQRRCEAILADFGRDVRALYPAEALERNGIHTEDRQGRPVFYGLLTLAIGVADPDAARCGSHHDVAALATEAKKEAKRAPGNALSLNPRRGP